MIWTGAGIAAFIGLWLAFAAFLSTTRRVSFRQGLLYAPLKAVYGIADDKIPAPDRSRGTIYVVSHRSRLDPAVMLSLLPDNTLHILDHDSAAAWWMEPFRELARTIAFNATHVFVSRRLVRILRGNGAIAVYLPENPEPDARSFRLYRAVARIALKADAAVVPVRLGRPGHAISDRPIGERIASWPSPPLALTVINPLTVEELRQRIGAGSTTASGALFDRVAQTRLADADRLGSVFEATAVAARRFGDHRVILDNPSGKAMSWRDLMVTTRLLAQRLADMTEKGDAIGLLLDRSPYLAPAFLATQSAGLAAMMLSASQDPGHLGMAIRAVSVRLVLASRAATGPDATALLAGIERAGARVVWVENLVDEAGAFELFWAGLLRNRSVTPTPADAPAAMFIAHNGRRAARLVLVTHRDLLTSAAQIAARLDVAGADGLMTAFAPSQSCGLVAGLLLPLLTGARFRPVEAGDAERSPSREPGRRLSFAPASRTAALSGELEGGTAGGMRAVILADTPLPPSVRSLLVDRSIEVLEAFALEESIGMVALSNTPQSKAGAVGRLMPAMRARLEPVEGLERGGRLFLCGPGLISGWMELDPPGRLQRFDDGWLDTGLLAAFDREGFLSIFGDAGRSAQIRGTNVALAAGEALAASLWPDARHLAVALPDQRRGERIVLLTTEAEADRTLLRRRAKAFGIAEIALPSDIVILESMPVDDRGQVDEEEAGRLAEAALGNSEAA